MIPFSKKEELAVKRRNRQQKGGIGNKKSASEIPRNVRQVKYEITKVRPTNDKDELATFLDKAQNEADYICNVLWT